MAYGTVNTDIVSDSSGGRLAPISSVFRNRIINGAMLISQRGSSFTPANGDYTLDRWQYQISQSSKLTVATSTDAPTGFSNSMLVTSSSAYSVGAGDYFSVLQSIEGFNTYDLSFGTANAKTITLSFWVKSSLTGTFGGTLINGSYSRAYPFTYTISSASTWTQISVTIAGDTTGTWVGATNGVGLQVNFGLGVGANNSATAGSWTGAGKYSATGAVSVVGTNGATWQVTGVQLEVGSSATGYEYRQYGQELALCQRYAVKFGGNYVYERIGYGAFNNSTNGQIYIQLPAPMRTQPSITSYSNLALYDGNAVLAVTNFTLATNATSTYIVFGDATVASGGTGYRPCQFLANATTSASFIVSAEL